MADRLRSRRRLAVAIAVAVAVMSCFMAGVWLTAAALGVSWLISLGGAGVKRIRGARRSAQAGSGFALATVPIAGVAWGLAAVAALVAPAVRVVRAARHFHPLHGLPLVLAHGHAAQSWTTLIDLLVAGALITSLLAVGMLRRPQRMGHPNSQSGLDRARGIVHEYGEDSLSPFILRPDKSFEFGAGGVAAYRVIGETAVVSGDPVGPDDSVREVLAQLMQRAHQAGTQVVVYGGSERHLETYRGLGLRVLCVGEEAVVDPSRFTLEGRPVRKLRQSVHRVERRGWRISVAEGRDIDAELEAEIDALEAAWRAERGQLLGFAMSMGEFELGVRPSDVYALAWSPNGRLQAVMRFLAHRGKLSLDTMRRVGETPNGLNEALVCHALEFARARDIPEVSLNYAGLGHLVRRGPSGNWLVRTLVGLAVNRLRGRFQMDRLVLFNQKFSPRWRPRYLVYESRAALPRSAFRVLQAEGYVPERDAGRDGPALQPWLRPSAPLKGRFGG